jgi:hypothetical protein
LPFAPAMPVSMRRSGKRGNPSAKSRVPDFASGVLGH